MKINHPKASSPILFILVGGLGFGFAYGSVRSFHLSLIGSLLSAGTMVLILWLIFRQGRASSYNTAQSWAQAQVDIALEVTAQAQAKAQAISQALSLALSEATATATNNIQVNIPTLPSLDLINREIAHSLDQEDQKVIDSVEKLAEHKSVPHVNEIIARLAEGVLSDERLNERKPDVAMGERRP